MNRLIGSLYKRIRGHELDASDVPAKVVAGMFRVYGTDAVRGSFRRLTYGASRGAHFRASGVSIRTPSFLKIGRNVVFGKDVFIEAYSYNGVVIGDGVTVGKGSDLRATTVIREKGMGLSIGPNTSIGICNILWGQGDISIGKDCLFGPNVTLISENHRFNEIDKPIRLQGNERFAITVEDDCWLGANSTVLAGVTIGKGSVVAAGAVVTKSIEPYSIVGGIPARVIGQRRVFQEK